MGEVLKLNLKQVQLGVKCAENLHVDKRVMAIALARYSDLAEGPSKPEVNKFALGQAKLWMGSKDFEAAAMVYERILDTMKDDPEKGTLITLALRALDEAIAEAEAKGDNVLATGMLSCAVDICKRNKTDKTGYEKRLARTSLRSLSTEPDIRTIFMMSPLMMFFGHHPIMYNAHRTFEAAVNAHDREAVIAAGFVLGDHLVSEKEPVFLACITDPASHVVKVQKIVGENVYSGKYVNVMPTDTEMLSLRGIDRPIRLSSARNGDIITVINADENLASATKPESMATSSFALKDGATIKTTYMFAPLNESG